MPCQIAVPNTCVGTGLIEPPDAAEPAPMSIPCMPAEPLAPPADADVEVEVEVEALLLAAAQPPSSSTTPNAAAKRPSEDPRTRACIRRTPIVARPALASAVAPARHSAGRA